MHINHSIRILNDNQFRFWLSIVVLLTSFILSLHGPSDKFLAFIILFLTYCLFFGFAHVQARRSQAGALLQFSLLAVDVIFITAAIQLTGIYESPLFILYGVFFGLCIYHDSWAELNFSVVLSFLLYGGLAFWNWPLPSGTYEKMAGQLLLLLVFTGALFALLKLIDKHEKTRDRLLSQARTLAHISDVLSGSLTLSRDYVKTVSDMIEVEMAPLGFECRLLLQRPEQRFFLPSGGGHGVHIPIMGGEYIFGTLVVLPKEAQPLKSADHNFLSAVARSLGIYLHRSKIWEDFQKQLENVESALTSGPSDGEAQVQNRRRVDQERERISHMIELMRYERGKWKLQKDVCDFSRILKEELESARSKAEWRNVTVSVKGLLENIPLFLGDPVKLRELVSQMLNISIFGSPAGSSIVIQISIEDRSINLFLADQGEGGPAGNIGLTIEEYEAMRELSVQPPEVRSTLGLVVCKKIVDAHGGFMSAESKGPGMGRLFTFSIPLEPVPFTQAVES